MTFEVVERTVMSGNLDMTMFVYDGSSNRTDALKVVAIPYPPGYKMTFSMWTISNGTDTEIIVNALGTPFMVPVGSTWSRCEFTIDNPVGRDILITPTDGSGFYLYKAQLEVGEIASDWVPSPEEFYVGSVIAMDENHIYMGTKIFEVDISNGAEILRIDEDGVVTGNMTVNKRIIAPNIAEKYSGPSTISIGTAQGGGDQTASYPAFSDLARDLNNKLLPNDVVITLTSDVYSQTWFGGMSGMGNITINGAGYSLIGDLSIYNQNVTITFNNLTIVGSVGLSGCRHVVFDHCTLNGNDSTVALYVGKGSICHLISSLLYSAGVLARVYSGSTFISSDIGGDGATQAFLSGDTSTILMHGTRPDGAVSLSACLATPSDPSTLNIYTGGGGSPENPTKVLPAISANATRTYYEGYWYSSSDNGPRQGVLRMSSGAKVQSGCMWFDMSSASGLALRGATLTLTRIAGRGSSGDVEVILWGTKQTGPSGYATRDAENYGSIGTIGNGETKEFPIPVAAVTDLCDGTIGGLMLQSTDSELKAEKDYSRNYAVFSGAGTDDAPKLTITYSE